MSDDETTKQLRAIALGNHISNEIQKAQSELAQAPGYIHPTTIQEFEAVYRSEYEHELESCDRWIKWCGDRNDYYGVNFHRGMRSAHVFNNIKLEQLLRVLKQEAPNAGHNTKLSGGGSLGK